MVGVGVPCHGNYVFIMINDNQAVILYIALSEQ